MVETETCHGGVYMMLKHLNENQNTDACLTPIPYVGIAYGGSHILVRDQEMAVRVQRAIFPSKVALLGTSIGLPYLLLALLLLKTAPSSCFPLWLFLR